MSKALEEDLVHRLRANAKRVVDSLGHLGQTLDDTLEHRAAEEIEALRLQRDNLAAMIMRLCNRLKRFDPETKTTNEAVDLLRRNGLGSPLRKS